MSNLFSKHFHLCFFKLKYLTVPPSPPHPQHHRHRHHHTASPSSSSSAHSTSKSTDDFIFFSSSSSSDYWDFPPQPPADFASVISSQRFFFSSPGCSNSIIESPDTSRPCNSVSHDIDNTLIPKDGVRVTKFSVNPYLDFRRSMQEMIHSRSRELVDDVDVRKDWDYLHELLLCYLALNPPHTHKYIVRAFTDLVVELMQPSPSSVLKTSHCRKPKNQRQSSFSGRLVNNWKNINK